MGYFKINNCRFYSKGGNVLEVGYQSQTIDSAGGLSCQAALNDSGCQ